MHICPKLHPSDKWHFQFVFFFFFSGYPFTFNLNLKKREVRYEPCIDTVQMSQYKNHLPCKLQTGITYRADDIYMFVYEIANKISATTTKTTNATESSQTWIHGVAFGKVFGIFILLENTLWLNYFDGLMVVCVMQTVFFWCGSFPNVRLWLLDL